MKKLIVLLSINALVGLMLIFIYYISGFLLGYAANSSTAHAAKMLYLKFGIAAMLINLLILFIRKEKSKINIAISFVFILLFYFLIGKGLYIF